MPTKNTAVVLVLVSIATVACSHDSDRQRRDEAPSSTSSVTPTTVPEREGDVRIVTTDGGLDLALLGDSISGGLSQASLAKARAGTDTSTVKGSGLGASIEKMVKKTVQGALGTRVSFPLSAVKTARYENGRIEFEWTDKPVRLFEQTKVNGRPVLESFAPADAERFVEAVRARKRSSNF